MFLRFLDTFGKGRKIGRLECWKVQVMKGFCRLPNSYFQTEPSTAGARRGVCNCTRMTIPSRPWPAVYNGEVSVFNERAYFQYSKDLVVSPVYRHIPYSKNLVVSPISRHFPYYLGIFPNGRPHHPLFGNPLFGKKIRIILHFRP